MNAGWPDFISARHYVQRWAELTPTAPAATAGDCCLDYATLAQTARQLAQVLKAAGVSEQSHVALVLPNGLAFIAWYLAVLETGAIVFPLPTAFTADEIDDVLRVAGVPLLVAPSRWKLAQALSAAAVHTSAPPVAATVYRCAIAEKPVAHRAATPDGFYVRLLSSGSTGKPKHTLRREGPFHEELRHLVALLGLESTDRFLAAAPFAHTFGAKSLQLATLVGGMVTTSPSTLPGPLLTAAARDRCTVLHATPPILDALSHCNPVRGAESALVNLRVCCSAGSPLTRAVHDAFEARFGVSAAVQYGSAEALTMALDHNEGFIDGRVGRPLPGKDIAIFDASGARLGVGERGRVGIKSDVQITREEVVVGFDELVFEGDYYCPGDSGELDDEGRLHLHGRSDIINIGGAKVDRAEVEAVIMEALEVDTVIVTSDRLDGRTVIRAWVEADPQVVTRRAVITACRARLAPFKVPSLVDVLAEFPRNDLGKVRRKELFGTPDET